MEDSGIWMLSTKALLPNNWIVERPAALLKKGTKGFPDFHGGEYRMAKTFVGHQRCRWLSSCRAPSVSQTFLDGSYLDLFRIYPSTKMSICPSKSLTPKGGSYHPKKRDPTRYCLGWTFSWSMNACQKSQRCNGPNMKQGFGGQNVKLHPLNHLKFLTFPNLLSWRPAFNEASCCQSRAGAEKRRVFFWVVFYLMHFILVGFVDCRWSACPAMKLWHSSLC